MDNDEYISLKMISMHVFGSPLSNGQGISEVEFVFRILTDYIGKRTVVPKIQNNNKVS